MKRYDIDCDCDGGHIAGDLISTECFDGDWVNLEGVLVLLDAMILRAEARPQTVLPILRAHRDILLGNPATIKATDL